MFFVLNIFNYYIYIYIHISHRMHILPTGMDHSSTSMGSAAENQVQGRGVRF